MTGLRDEMMTGSFAMKDMSMWTYQLNLYFMPYFFVLICSKHHTLCKDLVDVLCFVDPKIYFLHSKFKISFGRHSLLGGAIFTQFSHFIV